MRVWQASDVGQLLMVGFRPEEEDQVLSLVAKGQLGGLVLFRRNARDAMAVAQLCGRLRHACARAAYPLACPIVAVDQEQGSVCRIEEGVTRFPGPSVLGGLDRPATTARVARWVARELGALGVHLNLAPVADVPETDPAPSVLLGRAFASEPDRVARHVKAWVRGSQKAGLAACAKHFPGHGAAAQDSHVALPRDVAPLATVLGRHLRPFVAAVRAGVASVMMGHVAYDALDAGTPASLSPRVIHGLLRGVLDFQGLVLTDDLEMGAVGGGDDPVGAAVQALRAGADMALVGRNLRGEVTVEGLIHGIGEAIEQGSIPHERLVDALRRVEAFKRRWIPDQWSPPQAPPAGARARRLANRLEAFAGSLRGGP